MARERHRLAHSDHFLTASTKTSDRKWDLGLGATDYFTTPSSLDDLLAACNQSNPGMAEFD